MNSSATYIHKKNVSSQKTRTLNKNKHKEWLKKINILHSKKSFKPLVKTTAAYIHAYVEHKMKRWDKEHPKPWKWEGTEQFLFENEYLKPWEQERENQLEYTRNFVCSVYNSLTLIGRYEKSPGEYVEKPLCIIRNETLYNDVNKLSSNDKFIKNLQSFTNNEKLKNKNLICINIKDSYRKIGRLLLPIAA